MATDSIGEEKRRRAQQLCLVISSLGLFRWRLLCAVLFSSGLLFATVYTATLAYWTAVLFALHADFLLNYPLLIVALVHMSVICAGIAGGVLLLANTKPRGRLRGIGRLRRRVWKKINDGEFGKLARALFFVVGTPFVFWLQFLGSALESKGFQSGATMPINPTFTTHETHGSLKRLGDKGSLYGPALGACQGRHCVGCLVATQHSISRTVRMWRA